MALSLRAATNAETFSVMDVAERHAVTRPVSVRDLLLRIPADGVFDDAAPPDYDRLGWSNWLGDYESQRLEAAPASKAELYATVRDNTDGVIRAVGSGHSHSKAAVPQGRYIDLKNLTGTLPDEGWLKPTAALDVDDERYLVRLKGGTRLRDLNRQILAPMDLALENMGSFDGQTIAGAVNTGTHGTGMGLSTIADLVRSVEIVTVMSENEAPAVRMFRIEPSDGITDPQAFFDDRDSHGMGLIQDDDLFYSIVVSYGCMGVVYAYTLEVRDFYWLRERSESESWLNLGGIEEFEGSLETEPVEADDTDPGDIPAGVPDLLSDHRHVQLLINLPVTHNRPYKQATTMVRTHDVVDEESKPGNWEVAVDDEDWVDSGWYAIPDDRWPPERRRTPFQTVSRRVGNNFHPLKDKSGWGGTLRTFFFRPITTNAPFIRDRNKSAWYIALRRLRDRNTEDQNYEEMPEPPGDRAISTDIAVPLEHLVDAVEDVFEIADDITHDHEVDPVWNSYARTVASIFGGSGPGPTTRTFKVHFGSPMGVRFIAPSDHYLAAAHDRWSAMVEVPFPVEPANAQLRPAVPNLSHEEMLDLSKESLREIQTHLVEEYDGRPHLGKYNTLDSGDLSRLYDRFDDDGGWMETYRTFNPFGIFDSPFTDKLGISQG